MTPLFLLVVAQVGLNLNTQPVLCMDEGAYCSVTRRQAFEVNCSGAGITCTQTAGRMTLTVPGGGSGGGAPVDGGYLTLTAGSTGSSNEVVLSGGTNIAISGGGVVSVTGTVASATTASTATALAANPTDCAANQFATTIAANGNLTCAAVNDATGVLTGGVRLTGDLGGTATSPTVVDDSHAHTGTTISALDTGDITTGTLSQARGGTGTGALTCSAGDFITSNGTTYSCATPAGGGGGLTAAQVQRLVAIGGP